MPNFLSLDDSNEYNKVAVSCILLYIYLINTFHIDNEY